MAEKASVRTGAGQSYSEGGLEITGSRFHIRSVLPRLAGEHGDGQESQWKVENVRRFHGPEQGLLKDSYPLLLIDALVESTARHQLLSFMDAFFGYNQIKLNEADQEKTSFLTN